MKVIKRIHRLEDVESVSATVGPYASGWVTAMDSAEDVADDDLGLPGNRLVALNSAGVAYPHQMPGSYVSADAVIHGRMDTSVSPWEFYAHGEDTPVEPDIGKIYLDDESSDTYTTAYRWNSVLARYEVCPSDLRDTDGYGTRFRVDADTAHATASVSLSVGPDTVPGDSAPDPHDPGQDSIRPGRSIGFVGTDGGISVAHAMSEKLASRAARKFGRQASAAEPAFGSGVTVPKILFAGSHADDFTNSTVSIPGSMGIGAPGLVMGPGDAVPGALGTPGAGTLDGRVAYADHVHGASGITFDGITATGYSLGDSDDTVVKLGDILKVVPPDSPGISSAGKVLMSGGKLGDMYSGTWGELADTGARGDVVIVPPPERAGNVASRPGDEYYSDGVISTMVPATGMPQIGLFPLLPGALYQVTCNIGTLVTAGSGDYGTGELQIRYQNGTLALSIPFDIDMSITDMYQVHSLCGLMLNPDAPAAVQTIPCYYTLEYVDTSVKTVIYDFRCTRIR